MSERELKYFTVEWAEADHKGRRLLRGYENKPERFNAARCTFEITAAGVLVLDDGQTRTHWHPSMWVRIDEVFE